MSRGRHHRGPRHYTAAARRLDAVLALVNAVLVLLVGHWTCPGFPRPGRPRIRRSTQVALTYTIALALVFRS